MLDILCLGPQWRGSNAGGLFRALLRQGCRIDIVDEFYEIPLCAKSIIPRVLSRIARQSFIKEYNNRILEHAKVFDPQIVFVYKGAFVLPSTLFELRKRNYLLANFYPDVSFHNHGSLLQKTLPLYDLTFTTKTFGRHDMQEQLGITQSVFIPHGFDPEIHRPMEDTTSTFSCDVSFIGTWSPKKERYLKGVIDALPGVDLNIWGSQWEQSNLPSKYLKYTTVVGDLYSLAINSSKINLSLLLERVRGASSGDLITSRTFHIPGAGGFMLHERTSEVKRYFTEGEEMDCFQDEEELVEQIQKYLAHSDKREIIAKKGHERALKEHSLDHRAKEILKIISERI